MSRNKVKTIGIVGGMGPRAGLDLFDNILNNTDTNTDQGHLPVILMSLPNKIVDRTLFLQGKSNTNPAYEIAKVILKLELSGADVVGIACNTSYSSQIYDVLSEELIKNKSNVDLIHMPLETVKVIKEEYAGARNIGVMSTTGTYLSKVYSNLLTDFGFNVIIPDEEFQSEIIHRMIYDLNFGIKANQGKISTQAQELFDKAVNYFKNQQCDAVILGCTELSSKLSTNFQNDIFIVDSLNCLSNALIRESKHKKKEMNHLLDVCN